VDVYGKHVLDFSKRANIADFVGCTFGHFRATWEGLGELSYVCICDSDQIFRQLRTLRLGAHCSFFFNDAVIVLVT